MATDLGLDDLVNEVKNLPADSKGFARNVIRVIEAAFLSDRNPFAAAATGDADPPDPPDPSTVELSLPSVASRSLQQNIFDTITLPAATGGSGLYTYTLSALGGTSFNIPGMNFNAASRVLSGTPTGSGIYTLVYTVTDGSATIARSFTITITTTAAPFKLPDTPNQTAQLNQAVSIQLPAATGGRPPYRYALSNLHPGLNFNPANRKITGAPSRGGQRVIHYQAWDSATPHNDYETDFFFLNVEIPSTAPIVGSVTGNDSSIQYLPPSGNTLGRFRWAVGTNFPPSWFETAVLSTLALFIFSDGRLSLSGINFVPEIERDIYLTFSSARAPNFTIRGPAYPTNQLIDTEHIYSWIPDAAGLRAAKAFYNGLTAGDAVSITFRYNG